MIRQGMGRTVIGGKKVRAIESLEQRIKENHWRTAEGDSPPFEEGEELGKSTLVAVFVTRVEAAEYSPF
jgi:hypothetical protein